MQCEFSVKRKPLEEEAVHPSSLVSRDDQKVSKSKTGLGDESLGCKDGSCGQEEGSKGRRRYEESGFISLTKDTHDDMKAGRYFQ